ncbi:MAG: hypothetical protein Q4B99_05625 [Clostridia bacterium]|nr:hypothetical protein [Clostridia bacterium]
MKRLIFILLVLTLALPLCACANAVSDESRRELRNIIVSIVDRFLGLDYSAVQRAADPSPTPGQADDIDEPEYRWVITIDEAKAVNVAGVTTDYEVRLRAEHIGATAQGHYAGELDISYDCDLGLMELILTRYTELSNHKLAGNARSSEFSFHLLDAQAIGYQEALELFTDSFGTPLTDKEQLMFDKALESFGGYDPEEDPFESSIPSHFWWDWAIPYSEGGAEDFFSLSSLARSAIQTYLDEGGDSSDLSVSAPILDSYHMLDYAALGATPYTLSLYDGGSVVMTFYSPDGGPFSVKFYGTLQKLPLSNES